MSNHLLPMGDPGRIRALPIHAGLPAPWMGQAVTGPNQLGSHYLYLMWRLENNRMRPIGR